MKLKNIICIVVQILARCIASVSRSLQPSAFSPQPSSLPPPEQLTLDLDHAPAADLPLRDALPVRSAEYWLQLGQPDQALKELETLPETVRNHPWPLRVHLAAFHAANVLAA